MAKYNIAEFGTKLSTSYGLYIGQESSPISGWHDIPLYADHEQTYLNMVVEIPRWSNAKMEICKDQKLNPIKQDIKKGKLRYVDNVYPFKGYIWNYGAIPQTWEDPNHVDPDTKAKGDNDPLDVCEIGQKIYPRGSVIQVKPLGMLAMIDEGETDWKLIAIARGDPLEDKLNDISDVEKYMPGFLDDTRRWFRVYKMPQDKPANTFGFGGEFQNKQFANRIIKETNESWKKLIGGKAEAPDCRCDNVTVGGSPFRINSDEVSAVVNEAPPLKGAETGGDCCSSVEKWHFVKE